MADPADLYTLAHEFLAACQAALATTVEGFKDAAGQPLRSYVSPGPPAWDCEQLTVHVGGPAQAPTAPLAPPLQPAFRHITPGTVNLVTMVATVLRCVPAISDGATFPDPASIDAAAQVTLADVWAIWNYCKNQYRAKLLFTRPNGEPREFLYDGALALQTLGGLAGWAIQIRVQLDGYGA